MNQELRSRARDELEEAGNTWKKQAMGFFFPGHEDAVDLCALAVLDRALAEDGTRVPSSVRKQVKELIGTTSKTKDAISIVFLATARPVRA